jgi:hypothetical protein
VKRFAMLTLALVVPATMTGVVPEAATCTSAGTRVDGNVFVGATRRCSPTA